MFYCIVALHNEKMFEEWLKPSIEQLGTDIKTIIVRNIENDSIFKKYNRALGQIKVEKDDILCFIHEDVRILDKHFKRKAEIVFEKFKNTGVLGVIGSRFISEQLGWWLCDKVNHVGQIEQGLPDGSHFRMIKNVGFFEKIATVDGCCFFLSGRMVLDGYKFDEDTYKGKYHFYDMDTCLTAHKMGYNVSVADILIYHKSEGPMPSNWVEARKEFETKWKGMGYEFPFYIE